MLDYQRIASKDIDLNRERGMGQYLLYYGIGVRKKKHFKPIFLYSMHTVVMETIDPAHVDKIVLKCFFFLTPIP